MMINIVTGQAGQYELLSDVPPPPVSWHLCNSGFIWRRPSPPHIGAKTGHHVSILWDCGVEASCVVLNRCRREFSARRQAHTLLTRTVAGHVGGWCGCVCAAATGSAGGQVGLPWVCTRQLAAGTGRQAWCMGEYLYNLFFTLPQPKCTRYLICHVVLR